VLFCIPASHVARRNVATVFVIATKGRRLG